MPTSITEYAGMAWLRAGVSQFPAPQEPALAVTLVSSAGSSDGKSTLTFSSNTNLVQINSQVNFWCLFGSSLMVGSTNAGGNSTVSSTSAQVLAGNMPHYRGVTPRSKLIGWST